MASPLPAAPAAAGGAPALAPGLNRKLRKVLDTRTDAPEVTGSLATLSAFYGANTPAARRHLRSTVEAQGAAAAGDALAAEARVLAALDAVQGDLDAVARACDGAAAALADSRAAAADLLAEVGRLRGARAAAEVRGRLVGTFLERYQLSPAEAEALRGGEVGDAFFAALAHVRAVHANCRALLRTHHQRAGLELLDATGALQEAAYASLARWLRARCAALADVDAPEVDAPLARAAAALRGRPALARLAAEEAAAARAAALFQRFLAALTRGPRPIEMAAPDPWRFVSDMLAWLHAALAGEREFFEALFGDNGGGGGDQGAGGDAAGGDADGGDAGAPPAVSALLDAVFEGVCRPLRVRVEQVLMSAPPPLLAFRLQQLLAFHLGTANALLGGGSRLSEALRACRAMAARALAEALRARGDKAVRAPPAPPRDLSPPPAVVEGAALLAELLAAYEASLDGGAGGAADAAAAAAEFDAVLAAVAGPLAEAAERGSEALDPSASARLDDGAHLNPTDARVYVLNCLAALRAPLAGRPAAAARLAALDAAAEAQVGALVAAEAGRALAAAGLAEVSARLALYARGGGAAGAPAADPALALPRVAAALRAFFGRLSDPAALPELRRLRDPAAKAAAQRRALAALADAYAAVHGALADPASGYPAAEVAAAVRHSPADVRTLLGVAE
jgi:hypothetical protein